jgi:hypothetical protein
MRAGEYLIRQLRIYGVSKLVLLWLCPLQKSLIRANRPRCAFAIAYAALAAHFDHKDSFSCCDIFDNLYVSMLQILRLIWAKACITHEK